MNKQITDEQVEQIIEQLIGTNDPQQWAIVEICGAGYDWTHMSVGQRDKLEDDIFKCTYCKKWRCMNEYVLTYNNGSHRCYTCYGN